ncbi:MAG: DUF4350 domain-containing protein [Pseudomonadota bacterium]
MNRRVLLLCLLLVALLALAVRLTAVMETVNTPPSQESRQNDFLALGRLAAALGARVTPMRELPGMPPAGATLWLTVPGRMLGGEQTGQLLDWVRAGGRLVLAPRTGNLWENDPLLAAAGLVLANPDHDWIVEQLGVDTDEESRDDYGYETYDFHYAVGDAHSLQAGFDIGRNLETVDGEAAGTPEFCDPVGCHVWRMTLGDGEVIALSEAAPFDNDNIGSLDHAALAVHLLAPAPGRTLWLVYEEKVPSIFAVLWQHAAFAVLALLVAVLLWIAAAAPRFGPLQPGVHTERRRLAEHVIAAGRLLVQQRRQRDLWQVVHDDFRRTLHRRHPQAHGLSDHDLAALIARHAGIEAAQVHAALAPPAAGGKDKRIDDAALADAIRRLDTLRRLL